MKHLAWIVLAACGGPAELTYDVKTKDTVTETTASFADVATPTPRVDVTGPAGDYTDFIRAAVTNKNEAGVVKLVVGGDAPSGKSGHLTVKLTFDVLWWNLPNSTKASADVTVVVDYKHMTPAEVGRKVGDIAVHYLDSRRPKHPGVPPAAGPATAVAMGKSIACSLHADTSVHCWGQQIDPLVGEVPSKTTITKAVEIATNDSSVCARLDTGEVKCLGRLDPDVKKHAVASVCGLDKPTKLALGVATGCAIVDGGKVRCWDTGKLDSREPKCGHASTEIDGVANATALAVNFGGACALAGGKALCWKLDETKATPAKLPAGVDVGVGFDPCVVEASGAITCATDPKKGPGLTMPKVEPGTKVVLDPMYGCEITAAGQELCWGVNSFGLMGDDHEPKVPVAVLDNVISTSLGIAGMCSVTKDGAVWCAGKREAPLGLAEAKTKLTKLVIY